MLSPISSIRKLFNTGVRKPIRRTTCRSLHVETLEERVTQSVTAVNDTYNMPHDTMLNVNSALGVLSPRSHAPAWERKSGRSASRQWSREGIYSYRRAGLRRGAS